MTKNVQLKWSVAYIKYQLAQLYNEPDNESTEYIPYLIGENIFFRATDDIFNNSCPGEYFTAAIVNTGRERV